MTTTTPGAIRDAIITRIAGLTPPAPVTPRFVSHRADTGASDTGDLRKWCATNPTGALRRFDCRVTRVDEPLVTPVNSERQILCALEVVIGYAVNNRFTDARGLETRLEVDREFVNRRIGTESKSGFGFEANATIVTTSVEFETVGGLLFAVINLEATFWRGAA